MLEAAARLFGTHRFHEVRMEDIATEAAVGKGTLYRYFQDKEELYWALLTRSSEQLLARLEEVLEPAQGARQRLVVMVDAIIAFFDENPHLFDLIQRAEVHQRPGVASPWQQTRDDLLRLVLGLFEAGRHEGEFTIRHPEVAVLMLLGGLRSVIRFGDRLRPPELACQIVTDFLRGAAAEPSGLVVDQLQ
jgi:AcrR family transcriptional regulator